MLRLFEARDHRDDLAADDALLDLRFSLVPGAQVTWRAHGPRLAEREARVQLESGIGFAAPISPELAARLASLDDSRRLGELARGDPQAAAELRALFALGLVSARQAP